MEIATSNLLQSKDQRRTTAVTIVGQVFWLYILHWSRFLIFMYHIQQLPTVVFCFQFLHCECTLSTYFCSCPTPHTGRHGATLTPQILAPSSPSLLSHLANNGGASCGNIGGTYMVDFDDHRHAVGFHLGVWQWVRRVVAADLGRPPDGRSTVVTS
jgi:hypothetical protein